MSYAGCSTCRKAIAWLGARGIAYELRAIAEQPPTVSELRKWVPKSGKPLSKWLNVSGQSYRALGKERIAGASEDDLIGMLAADGKLVKRPLLITPSGVVVGYDEEAYAKLFGR